MGKYRKKIKKGYKMNELMNWLKIINRKFESYVLLFLSLYFTNALIIFWISTWTYLIRLN